MTHGLPDLLLSASMSRRLGLDAPRSYLAPGQGWPYGDLIPGTPAEVYLARSLSRNFRGALKDRRWSQQKASGLLGLSTHTVNDLYHGRSWPSIAVIARIEQRLNVDLWTTAHKLAGGPDYHGGKGQLS